MSTRLLTVPNALSVLRLAGVPLFLWLLFSGREGWAVLVLVLSGLSDYLDGMVARRYHLESRMGQLLDPMADRLYILSTIVALAVLGALPVWFVVLLLGRDLFMGVLIVLLRRVGQTGLPVHVVGKAATFNLLVAFPLLLLAHVNAAVDGVARPLGWAFAWWGVGLYWLAAALYAVQAIGVLRSRAAHPVNVPGSR